MKIDSVFIRTRPQMWQIIGAPPWENQGAKCPIIRGIVTGGNLVTKILRVCANPFHSQGKKLHFLHDTGLAY